MLTLKDKFLLKKYAHQFRIDLKIDFPIKGGENLSEKMDHHQLGNLDFPLDSFIDHINFWNYHKVINENFLEVSPIHHFSDSHCVDHW